MMPSATEWARKNPEKHRANSKKWRMENPEKTKESCKKWRFNNLEKVRKKNREYMSEHKDRFKKSPERSRVDARNYYWRDPERSIAQVKAWAERNPDSVRRIKKVRFHRERGAGPLSVATIQQVYLDNIEKNGILTCVLCEQWIEKGQDSLEHLTPISRGGTNRFENLAVAHRSCNSKKQNKTLLEYKGAM